MSSTFSGLNTAASGLAAQQAAMSVLGHNIANANNPAYRRQQVVMSARYASLGSTAGAVAGPLGAGVDVTTIRRMQDGFLDTQLLSSGQDIGRWTAGKEALDQIVAMVGEPSDTGLASSLDKFWNAWQDVSLHPESVASRNALVGAGKTVAASLNNLYTRIDGIRAQQDQAIRGSVDTINSLTSQLATVNGQIQQTRAAGGAPNDLLDKRDDLLSQLSGIANIQIHGDGGTNDVISIGGHVLVQGARAEKLATGSDASGHATVLWAEDGAPVDVRGGALGGILNVSNDLIPGYLSQLDGVAQGMITRVNELHSAGYGLDGTTGTDFFTGAGARDMNVNAAIANNPRLIATSAAAGTPGDGSIALAIAKVKGEAVIGQSTIGDAYAAFVSKSGGDAALASDRLDAQTKINQQLTVQQQSVSGVSLDEEMADMVRFQQSYNASARVLTTMDSMINTLINNMGAVG